MRLLSKRGSIRRTSLLAVLAIGAVLLPATAFAANPSGTEDWGVNSDNGARHDGLASWDAGDTNDFIYLYSKTRAVPGGKCIDLVFDWETSDNIWGQHRHMDLRVLRNCADATAFTNDGTGAGTREDDSRVSSDRLIGVQLLGMCVRDKDTGNPTNCNSPIGVDSNVKAKDGPACYGCWQTRVWRKNTDGTYSYWNGGDPTDPDA